MPEPRSFRPWDERSNTSTSHPLRRKAQAAAQPEMLPPTIPIFKPLIDMVPLPCSSQQNGSVGAAGHHVRLHLRSIDQQQFTYPQIVNSNRNIDRFPAAVLQPEN